MKVLAYTSPARGHLYPTVAILTELQRRGHEVAIRTLAGEVNRLRDIGIAAEAIQPEIEAAPLNDYLAKSPMGALKRTVQVTARRAIVEVPDLQSAIEAHSPDLLLIDTNTWGAAAAAEAWGGDWALLQHFLTPLPSVDSPPFGPGLKPMGGRLGRVRNRLLGRLIIGSLERQLLPPVNEIRRSLSLPRITSATEFSTRAPLTLYLTSSSFDYPRASWPDSYCFTGPVTWEPPVDPPTWLADVTRPLVLVSTSSEFQDDGAIATAALEGLAGENVEVLVSLPSGIIPTAMPANARVERWVPHAAVLPHAEVAIVHGGMGVTQKALLAGVPVVVVPWGRDQLEVGRRVEHAGVGVLLSKRKLSAQSLRAAVVRARQLKPAAQRFAEALRQEGGVALAADRLEQLSSDPRPTPQGALRHPPARRDRPTR